MSTEQDRTAPEPPEADFREIARLCRAQAHNSALQGDPISAREWIKAGGEALHVAELRIG